MDVTGLAIKSVILKSGNGADAADVPVVCSYTQKYDTLH